MGFYEMEAPALPAGTCTITVTGLTAATAYNWQLEVNGETPGVASNAYGQVIASGTVPSAP